MLILKLIVCIILRQVPDAEGDCACAVGTQPLSWHFALSTLFCRRCPAGAHKRRVGNAQCAFIKAPVY